MHITNDQQKSSRSGRLTLLRFTTGFIALAIASSCLLCIYFHSTPAHASARSYQTNSTTAGGQIVLDDTETETPSKTPTHTPSPTVTSTTTPAPSPSATYTAVPSPTSQGQQTPSSSATPGRVVVQGGTGAGLTPVVSPATSNNQTNPASQASQADNGFPYMPLLISLGSLALLGFLFRIFWSALRPFLPGQLLASSGRRRVAGRPARKSSRQDILIAQRAFDLAAPQSNAMYDASLATPYAGPLANNPDFHYFSTTSQPGSFTISYAPVPAPGRPGSLLRDYAGAYQKQAPETPGDPRGMIEFSDPNLRVFVGPF